jgi:hypothetical protein
MRRDGLGGIRRSLLIIGAEAWVRHRFSRAARFSRSPAIAEELGDRRYRFNASTAGSRGGGCTPHRLCGCYDPRVIEPDQPSITRNSQRLPQSCPQRQGQAGVEVVAVVRRIATSTPKCWVARMPASRPTRGPACNIQYAPAPLPDRALIDCDPRASKSSNEELILPRVIPPPKPWVNHGLILKRGRP